MNDTEHKNLPRWTAIDQEKYERGFILSIQGASRTQIAQLLGFPTDVPLRDLRKFTDRGAYENEVSSVKDALEETLETIDLTPDQVDSIARVSVDTLKGKEGTFHGLY